MARDDPSRADNRRREPTAVTAMACLSSEFRFLSSSRRHARTALVDALLQKHRFGSGWQLELDRDDDPLLPRPGLAT